MDQGMRDLWLLLLWMLKGFLILAQPITVMSFLKDEWESARYNQDSGGLFKKKGMEADSQSTYYGLGTTLNTE